MSTSYGPNENCTLSTCDITTSIYEYRPSIAASAVFITIFGISLVVHIYQGIRWRSWFFSSAMFMGCVAEMIGYGGRIIMWKNPFSFSGFLTQIVCISLAPAFFSAAIYLTLSKIIIYLGRQYARFSPNLYYWIFIPCDLVALTLQATGGAMSSSSSGDSHSAVDITIAGLSFQVFTLVIFILLAIDFAIRYLRDRRSQPSQMELPRSFKTFLGFLSLATLCILVRCVYRVDELSNGYSGPLIHNQGLFIGLEGVMIVIAAFALNLANPEPVLKSSEATDRKASQESFVEMN